MERTLRNHWTGRHAPGFAIATLCALTLVACGEQERFSNNPRPAAPLNVSAYISSSAVSVSPQRFGAGLVVVTVTNQSAESHDVTLEGGDPGELAQSTGPINPGDTGQLKVRVQEGTYALRTEGGGIDPAQVTVTAPRPTAQDEVLQP
jgi:hypothetical protein